MDIDNRLDLSICRHVVDLIGSYSQNWSQGEEILRILNSVVLVYLTDCLVVFMDECSKSDNNHIVEMIHNCQVTMKTLIAVIPKYVVQTGTVLEPWFITVNTKLMQHLVYILQNGLFTSNCQSIAAMTLVLVLKSLSNGNSTVDLILQCLLPHHIEESTSSWITDEMRKTGYTWTSLSPYCQLCVCHGVIAMLDADHLISQINEQQILLLDVIFPELMTLQTKLSDSYSILAASRTLTLWSCVAKQALEKNPGDLKLRSTLCGDGAISKKLLHYVWENSEHTIEGMRYQVKIIFDNIIEMHFKVDCEDSKFFYGIFQHLMNTSWHVRSKYSFLATMVTYLGSNRMLDLCPTLPRDILNAVDEQTVAPYASDLYERLLQTHKKESDEDTRWKAVWILPVLEMLQRKNYNTTLITQYCLPRILKRCPECLEYIQMHMKPSNQENLAVLITCLKVARCQGLLNTKWNDDITCWHGIISVSSLQQALCHHDNKLSLQALSLICDNTKTTESITSTDFQLIKTFLEVNMKAQSPADRHYIISDIKKFLCRIHESGLMLWKQRNKDGCQSQLELYKDFLEWLFSFLLNNLYPDACHPRRALALSVLNLMNDIFSHSSQGGSLNGVQFGFIDQLTTNHVQTILECLNDSYSKNREMALQLIKCSPTTAQKVSNLYEMGLDLAKGNKPQNSIVGANILCLVYQCGIESPEQILQDLLVYLREQIEIGKCSLLKAAAKYPIYGLLYCVRTLLKELSSSHTRIIDNYLDCLIELCLDASSIVSPVVCNSSPEGYLPVDEQKDASLEHLVLRGNDKEQNEDGDDKTSRNEEEDDKEEEGDSHTVTPQMVLICCWITMKEVSLLLGQLTQFKNSNKKTLLSVQQMKTLGDFFMDILMKARHRGAFELSYTGFEQLCHLLWRSEVKELNSLPVKWLQILLTEIQCTNEISQLCATRRSAGIPFAFQAILNAECMVQKDRPNFKHVMIQLLDLSLGQSVNDDTFAQVHSLNILCALYKDSELGEDVFPFIADGVKAAILGFNSELWGVRNSSMMLFNALITRIFGVKRTKDEHSKKNQLSGREFFSRFPSLHSFLLKQIKIVSQDTTSLQQSQFAILLLMSRLYSSTFDGIDSNLSLSEFVPYIQKCCSCSVWKTRTMAARTLASICPTSAINALLTSLIVSLPTSDCLQLSHNTIHGVLLQIYHVLEMYWSERLPNNSLVELMNVVLPQLRNSLWLITSSNKCDITRALYLHILNKYIFTMQKIPVDDNHKDFQLHVTSILREDTFCVPSSSMVPGTSLLQETIAEITWKTSVESSSIDWLLALLNNASYEVRRLTLRNLIDCIKTSCDNAIKLCDSRDLFRQLIKMVQHEIDYDCLSMVFEVLCYHSYTLSDSTEWSSMLVTDSCTLGKGVNQCPKQEMKLSQSLHALTFLLKSVESFTDGPGYEMVPSSFINLTSKLVSVVYSDAVLRTLLDNKRNEVTRYPIGISLTK
ncbi:tRNA (32-2'-O)-methyltransferase regulator THADA-like [Saccoglossus kowalevskii]